MLRNFLDRLLIRQQLTILIALLALPLVILGVDRCMEQYGIDRQLLREQGGAQFYPPLYEALLNSALHRGLQFRALSGETGLDEQLAVAARSTQAALNQIVERSATDNKADALGKLSAEIAASWLTLASAAPRDAAANFDAHTQFIRQLESLADVVAENSGMKLDDDTATFYIIDALSSRMAPLMNSLGIARGMGAAAALGQASPQQVLATRPELEMAERNANAMERSVTLIAQSDPVTASKIEQSFAATLQSTREFSQQLSSELQNTKTNGAAKASEIFTAGSATIASIDKLRNVLFSELEQRLQRRLQDARNTLYLTLSCLFLVALAVGFGCWSVIVGITRSLDAAVAAAGNIRDGRLDNAVAITGGVEMSALLRAMDGMRSSLLTAIEVEQTARAKEQQRQLEADREAEANARIRAALDHVTTNVMIADNNRDIIYMNSSVSEMMLSAEADIRTALPQFDARKLIGSSIDGFHKNPAHQRDMLASLRRTYRTQINVGGRTFSLIANPVSNPAGERIGSVVEWKDRTDEVIVEREVGDIVIAASNGDFAQRIKLDGKTGFFRQLGEGINQLVNTSEQGLKDIAYVLEALSRGDLTRSIVNDYSGTFDELKNYSNNTVRGLTQMLTQIRAATDAIGTAASEIAAGNTDLSSRTEQQASSLEETAASMEELTATVKQNADNARQANQLAVSASGIAEKGGNVVQNVVVTMGAINDSARKIADIISVIDGIAFQTNILALNAAVEAARAGEQGRGFAVVAAEVRNLAQRSASAAKEIKALITDSVEKVDNGNRLVNDAGSTMQEIVQAIKRVTDLMTEIAAASEEQSAGIEQINSAVTQMDEVTQQNAALVEQAAAAAESLREQSSTLAEAVSAFKFTASAAQTRSGIAVHNLPNSAAKSAAPKLADTKVKAVKLKSAKALKADDEEWAEF